MTDTPSGIEQREVEALVARLQKQMAYDREHGGDIMDYGQPDPLHANSARLLTTLLTENARLRAMVQPSEGLGR